MRWLGLAAVVALLGAAPAQARHHRHHHRRHVTVLVKDRVPEWQAPSVPQVPGFD